MKRKISLMLVFTFFTTSVFGNEFVTKDRCPFLTADLLKDEDFINLRGSFKDSMCELQSTLENCQAALKNQEPNVTCAKGVLTGSKSEGDKSTQISNSIKDLADLLVDDYRKINCSNLESSLIGMQEDYWNSYFNSNSTIVKAEEFFNSPQPEDSWGSLKKMINDVPSEPENTNYSFHESLVFLKEAPFSISDMNRPQKIYSTCHKEFAKAVKAVFNEDDAAKLNKFFAKDKPLTQPEDRIAEINKQIDKFKDEKENIENEVKDLSKQLQSLSTEGLLLLSTKISSG